MASWVPIIPGAAIIPPILLQSERHLPTPWLVAAVLLAMMAACSEGPSPTGDAGALGLGVYVGSTWTEARGVTGHQVHVVEKQIACSKCHELTSDSIGRVTPERCAACHQKQSRIEHAAAQAHERFGSQTNADCTTCHRFTREGTGHKLPDGGVPSAADCGRCHMQRQGGTPGVKVHGTSECLKCHRPHDDQRPQSAPCVDCHRDVATTHAAHGKTPTAVCSTCHQHQHAPASEALGTCVDCHAKQKPVVAQTALFAGGHSECVGCHRPHEFGKAAAIACRSCHEDVIVLGEKRVKQHAQCTSCHAAHDVRGSPDQACATCHRDKHPDHPKHGVAGSCVGCHDPHPASSRAHDRVRNCSSCHQAASSDKAFHGETACKQCHQPHHFVLKGSGSTVCQSCHAKELALVATAKGHQACQGCHGGLPHRPTALGVGCESCHAAERRQVHTGHTKCQSCHEPHGGTVGAPCQSCHSAEHRSAPTGHQDCQRCHQAHSGSTAKVACATCHATEAKTHHAKVAQGCNACHRAHGPEGVPKPPACASCHQTANLPGLHQVVKHQACANCHTGHGERVPNSQRAGCLSCHTERKNHFPDAPSCENCHIFNKSR